MAIKPECDGCKKELEEFGGLLFTPPFLENIVKKYHLCSNCLDKVFHILKLNK